MSIPSVDPSRWTWKDEKKLVRGASEAWLVKYELRMLQRIRGFAGESFDYSWSVSLRHMVRDILAEREVVTT